MGTPELFASDVLLTIAEFALALAGFSAVVLVLARRGGAIDEVASYIVRFMILNSVGAGFLALSPFVLFSLGVGEPLVWRIASGLYVLAAAAFAVPVAILEAARVGSRLSRSLNITFWAISVAAHVVQLGNLLGFPVPPSPGGFLLGVYLLLGLAGLQFVVVVFRLLR